MTAPHSTDLYIPAGKGILYIAEWTGTTPPTDPDDYTDVGNCISLEIEPTNERLPHYSSREQYRLKDKNPIISSEYSVNFELDEFAAVNLNKFFLGSLNTTTSVIAALQGSNIEFALKFISNNPSGPNTEFRMWKVTLSPAGPLQLISDGDYLTMSFAGEGLADTANHASSPYFDIKYVTTTTTTTTTSSTTTTTTA